MNTNVPGELQSTVVMINCAFPDGVEPWAYLPLLLVLYEYMSDRNLALVVAEASGKSYEEVLNDVYKVGGTPGCCPSDDVTKVLERLRPCGLDQWISEQT